jgi:hypothetical protein
MMCLLPIWFAGGPLPGLLEPRGPARHLAEGKGVLGDDLPYHLETANFTVQWSDASVDEDQAGQLAEDLETAWTYLVDEQGWAAPIASDAYLQWVILDPSLSGSGLTWLAYDQPEFPDGYAVMAVNPTYDSRRFARSVAVHEFGHALQFAVRDYYSGGADEPWYWEATSEWIAEKAMPDLDQYAYSTYWYAIQPGLRYASMKDYHQYGMLLLNAWLDEGVFGFVGITDVWQQNAGLPWDEAIAAIAGEELSGIIPEMAGAVAAEALEESSLYSYPTLALEDAPAEGSVELPDLLGTAYVSFPAGTPRLSWDGAVAVRYAADGAWGEVAPDGAFVAAITALDGAGVEVSWAPAPFDTGGEETGQGSGESGGPAETGGRQAAGPEKPAGAPGCGCGGSGPSGWPGGVAGAALVLGRRRARAA